MNLPLKNSVVSRRKTALSLTQALSNQWLLNNELVPSNGNSIDVYDPAHEVVIGTTPNCDLLEVDAAVKSSLAAFKVWSKTEGRDRAKILGKCADAIDHNASDLAMVLALETGKAHRTECIGEVKLISDIFRYFSSFGMELKGRTTPFSNTILAITTREPIGVVAGIVPWNMPLMFLGYKVAAPLIAGNAVVIKVPEIAPFTVLKVLDLICHLFPAGLLNAVVGYGNNTGQQLVEHPSICKVSFTGSVESGRTVYQAAAKNLKQVNLELGGKSPMLILPDCDLETAIQGAVSGIRFTRQAQSCTSSTRIYVPSQMLESFVEGVKDTSAKLVIGDPLDEKTDTGAIISQQQRDRIQQFIDRAIERDGLEPIVVGELPATDGLKNGAFMQPHLFINPPHDSEVVQKEIFGPVMCIFSYDDLDELVQRANDVEYGLSASIWGKDISKCLHMSRQMDVGFAQINQNAVMLPGLSYAGTKSSGFGSESSLESMITSFTREKTTIINIGEFSSEQGHIK